MRLIRLRRTPRLNLISALPLNVTYNFETAYNLTAKTKKPWGLKSAHGLERFTIYYLHFSALQADRSDKNNTGNNNGKSRLKICSAMVDPFKLASGPRLSECPGRVNKKYIDI